MNKDVKIRKQKEFRRSAFAIFSQVVYIFNLLDKLSIHCVSTDDTRDRAYYEGFRPIIEATVRELESVSEDIPKQEILGYSNKYPEYFSFPFSVIDYREQFNKGELGASFCLLLRAINECFEFEMRGTESVDKIIKYTAWQAKRVLEDLI